VDVNGISDTCQPSLRSTAPHSETKKTHSDPRNRSARTEIASEWRGLRRLTRSPRPEPVALVNLPTSSRSLNHLESEILEFRRMVGLFCRERVDKCLHFEKFCWIPRLSLHFFDWFRFRCNIWCGFDGLFDLLSICGCAVHFPVSGSR